MIGNNELRLCQAEMLIALQEYLDKRMGEYAPKVSNVEERDASFRVSLRERERISVATSDAHNTDARSNGAMPR